jgi:arylsulfatase A-like enzyme
MHKLAILFTSVFSIFTSGSSKLKLNKLPEHPNVIFIMADDLNDWVGCLRGHPSAYTPHIDRLAKRGVLFSNAHCQSPLCNPSRSSLLTSRRPTSTGIYGLAPHFRKVESLKNITSLPQHFHNNGYHTATNGKIHHDSGGNHLTLEFDVIGPKSGPPRPTKPFVETPAKHPAMDWGPFPERDDQTCDYEIVDAAIKQMSAAPAEKPFFIATGFRFPHVPCYAPQAWFDRIPVDVAFPPMIENDRADVPFAAWLLHWDLPEPRLSWLMKANQWRPLVRAYLASTAYMDGQIGRLLDALDASPRGKNTVIVLWSDHGYHLGEKGISGKNTLWERSTRVPLIISGPNIKPGECKEPAELLDLFPTLIDVCALPPVADLEGHSLQPQITDPTAKRAWPAITSHNQGNHAVRTTRWRFIQYRDGTRELYDMEKDPNEWTNLASDPAYQKVLAEHVALLPKIDLPPVAGSQSRVISLDRDVLQWEGKPVIPGDFN